jgi:putative endonuclease
MSRVKIDEGIRGEDLAINYLSDKGYDIKDRNFRLKGGEIDIVAIKNGVLVFVEVKTRTSNQFGTGFDAITPWKLKTLIKSAQYYKITHQGLPEAMRIDAIAIVLNQDGTCESFEHLENVSQ